jgi:hypothetical protein
VIRRFSDLQVITVLADLPYTRFARHTGTGLRVDGFELKPFMGVVERRG